ncbi:MAG: DUF3298 domain-containing protein [Bacteroidales bacterium]
MNRSKIIIYITSFMAFMLLSCNSPQGNEQRDNGLSFETTYLEDSIVIKQEDRTLSCHFYGSIELPNNDVTSYKIDEIRSLIKTMYFMDVEDPVDSFANFKFEEFENYIKERMEFEKSNNEEITPFDTRFEHTRAVSIALNKYNLLSIELLDYNYTGGAHGYESKRYLNVDLINNDSLTINKVFEDQTDESIKNLLFEKLMADYNVSSIDNLNEVGFFNISDITLSENFRLESDSLAFIYNQYEIAPYSMGRIEIKVSYKDLKPYMRDLFMIRLVK